MRNCTARIEKVTDVLEAGHRSGPGVAEVRYDGPAFASAPRRAWEQAAALEGQIDANLHVHGVINLLDTSRVQIIGHALAGEYQVVTATVTGNEWRLGLQTRRVR